MGSITNRSYGRVWADATGGRRCHRDQYLLYPGRPGYVYRRSGTRYLNIIETIKRTTLPIAVQINPYFSAMMPNMAA